jgi:hypothetical protein
MTETVKKSSRATAPAKSSKTATKKTTATASQKTTTIAAKKNTAMASEAAAHNHLGVSHDEVARLAHRFWTERGRQHGRHEEDWFRAEQELQTKAS